MLRITLACFQLRHFAIRLLALTVMVVLLLQLDQASAGMPEQAAFPPSPSQGQPLSAQGKSTARVIVQLRMAFQPEGVLPSRQAILAQRGAITQAQNRVLSQLSAFHVTDVKQYESFPFLAMQLDAAGLPQLQTSADVLNIQDDIPVPPLLAESVPLIGAPNAWAQGFTGAGQVVAIVDTGVDKTHPFLAGKVVSEACYSTNASGTAPDGTPYTSTTVCPGGVTQSTSPDSGVNCSVAGCEHGTHVAGIVAGKATGSVTFSGVAQHANLVAIQVFSQFNSTYYCSGTSPCVLSWTSDQILALQRVYALRTSYNIASTNMSLGGGGYTSYCDSASPSTKTAIDNLRSAGIATVIASGNSGYTNRISIPACISTAISVGSTKDGSSGAIPVDTVSSFSNSAYFLSLLAPGEYINSSVPGGGYSNWAGTSMATPHVAGAWAVLKSKLPTATVDQVLTALTSTGVSITDSRNGITKPRIQVDAAVNSLPWPTPTITGFNPPSGPVGTIVTISGTNFTGATSVQFNGTSATFTIVSATSINSAVPAGATTGRISIATPGGTATSASDFTVLQPPTITTFAPASGPVGTSVTIAGTNFTGATSVEFNGVNAAFNVVSATSIIATVPGSATSGPISVTTPEGVATSSSSFTVVIPILYAKPGATGTGDCRSWANACTLQTALTNSTSGQEIWVMQGTHKPTTMTTADRNATFQLKSGVGVYGGFAGTETGHTQRDPATNVTILSGDLNGDDNSNVNPNEPTRADNSYHVVTGSGTDSTAVLDGFTITSGNANDPVGCPGSGCGGGMYNYGGSPTLTNLVFTGNSAIGDGGGLVNWLGGGLAYGLGSSPTMSNVTFTRNMATNAGGALTNYGNSHATLTNVTFADNWAGSYGGAVSNHSNGNPTLTNVTLKSNGAPQGGGMYNQDSSPAVRNAIFWNNTAANGPQIYNSGGAPTVNDSVVQGGCPAGSTCSNIIISDPLLGVLGNYGGNTPTVPLLPGSSAINAGNATTCATGDQRGLSRLGICDLGAFESQGFYMVMAGGDNQSASINTLFANPLRVTVFANNASEPVNGGKVTFAAPSSGASVVMPSQTTSIASGSASAGETANGTTGAYQVTASAWGANAVMFNLTNTPPDKIFLPLIAK